WFLSCRLLCVFCFFFSSRRRHTRCYRDWSSDVCSSDLTPLGRPSGVAVDKNDMLYVIDSQSSDNQGATNYNPGCKRGIRVGSVRSEERRVGKECRCRWATSQYTKKKSIDKTSRCGQMNN